MGAFQNKVEPKYRKNGTRIPPPMAPLPLHLLPKALGGEAGEDNREVDINGIKKNNLSTFKKIKNKEQIQEEAIKNEEDAIFLEDLFQDNLSEDTDH